MKAFSELGTDAELLKLGRLLATRRLANGEVMGAMKQCWLTQEIETKAGKVNTPDDAPDKTLAAQPVNPGKLDGETPTKAPGTEEFNGEGAFP